MNIKRHLTRGFTIIELVVVIVIIGILATITLVVYGGIQQSAKQAVLLADNGNGLPIKSGTTYQYTVNTSTTSPSFCLTGTNGTSVYKISSTSSLPSAGSCP